MDIVSELTIKYPNNIYEKSAVPTSPLNPVKEACFDTEKKAESVNTIGIQSAINQIGTIEIDTVFLALINMYPASNIVAHKTIKMSGVFQSPKERDFEGKKRNPSIDTVYIKKVEGEHLATFLLI